METSAKNKNNVEEVFNSIVRTFLEKNGVMSTTKTDVKFELKDQSYKKKESSSMCC